MRQHSENCQTKGEVTVIDSTPLNKSMQDEERKGISDVESNNNDQSKFMDDLAVQVNDPAEFDNKKQILKVEISSIQND